MSFDPIRTRRGQDASAGGVVVSASAVVGAGASARGEPLFCVAGRGEMELLVETLRKSKSAASAN